MTDAYDRAADPAAVHLTDAGRAMLGLSPPDSDADDIDWPDDPPRRWPKVSDELSRFRGCPEPIWRVALTATRHGFVRAGTAAEAAAVAGMAGGTATLARAGATP